MIRMTLLCAAAVLLAASVSGSVGRAPATAAAAAGQITLKPDPKAAESVRPPVVSVGSITPLPVEHAPEHPGGSSKGGSKKSPWRYSLHVIKPHPSPADWYQSLENVLPPSKCSAGSATNMRMLVHVSLIRAGKTLRTRCYPLEKIAVDFYIDVMEPLLDTDAVSVTFEDRADGARYESQPYLIGWYGVANVLKTVDCKPFLGRAGNFLCTTDKGMAACENLRQKGKPIRCTRAGKAQP